MSRDKKWNWYSQQLLNPTVMTMEPSSKLQTLKQDFPEQVENIFEHSHIFTTLR